ncbi:hypothetical protein BDZ45DRAFT_678128 [Acephala macrosclerotiorum]|nr:hypothetical protein BDZ45DRAFT_678128 [Acephala macrosclerotiorum]
MMLLSLLAPLVLLVSKAQVAVTQIGTSCTVTPLTSSEDDTPQILSAFKSCGIDGSISFSDGIYHINQIMDITLTNCTVSLRGT